VYEVELITPDGRLIEMDLEAATGTLVEMDEEEQD
ncbi:MAG: peptidase, partial [Gemmobacter sp.]|nr:peptidase [Gemmobacter sp.]